MVLGLLAACGPRPCPAQAQPGPCGARSICSSPGLAPAASGRRYQRPCSRCTMPGTVADTLLRAGMCRGRSRPELVGPPRPRRVGTPGPRIAQTGFWRRRRTVGPSRPMGPPPGAATICWCPVQTRAGRLHCTASFAKSGERPVRGRCAAGPRRPPAPPPYKLGPGTPRPGSSRPCLRASMARNNSACVHGRGVFVSDLPPRPTPSPWLSPTGPSSPDQCTRTARVSARNIRWWCAARASAPPCPLVMQDSALCPRAIRGAARRPLSSPSLWAGHCFSAARGWLGAHIAGVFGLALGW